MTTKQIKTSISWFTVVGAAAALTHYIVAVGLESLSPTPAAWANFAGFMLAFPVSYFGHRHLSFDGSQLSHQQTLPKLFLVSASGFFANQLLLISTLRWLHWPFWLALGVVMVIIAASTFLLSRFWVFKA